MSEQNIKAIFKIRRGSYEDLKNYIPHPGEPIYEVDTNQIKIGGLDNLPYSDLPYLLGDSEQIKKQIEIIENSAEETKSIIKDFLADADVTENAVDTLKEIQNSLDAGEVSAANLLNKVNDLEAAHETYIEEHQAIRALIAQEDENLKNYFDTQLGVIANGLY